MSTLPRLLACSLLLLLPLTVTAKPVVVSSKIDTEGALLSHLILLSLDDAGIPVKNRVQLGKTSVVRNALLSGHIDIYPEYTGNGAFFFTETAPSIWKNPETGYEKIKQLDYDAHKLVWLEPSPANNTWAISVRGHLAREHQLETLDDLADFLRNDGVFKFAASKEFIQPSGALDRFQTVYNFELQPEQLWVVNEGDTTTTIRAAALQTEGVNAAMTYGTDGQLQALDLVVLEDNRFAQPVYLPTPVIREPVLNEYPQIAAILQPIFASLDWVTLQRLNAEIALIDGDPATVARNYLNALKNAQEQEDKANTP